MPLLSSFIFGSLAVWVVIVSVILLMPPFDKGVAVGDFSPPPYTGKLNLPFQDTDIGDQIIVEDYYFESGGGEKCHAWLYSITTEHQQQDRRPPVVVMAPGMGTQKDFGLDRYATTFVQEGFAVFLFDYRNFGPSEGTPRNWISPQRHIKDYHAALDFIQTSLQHKVDTSNVFLWGTSFSGGHVLEVTAQRKDDKNIKAIVSQVPHLNGRKAAKANMKKRGVAKVARLALATLQDVARSIMGFPPVTVRIIGTGKELSVMDVHPDDFTRYMAKHPPQKLGGWMNSTPARILLYIRFYNPIDALSRNDEQLQVPVLFIGASQDDLCPPGLIQEASNLIPNSKWILREGTHFEIYEAEHWKEMAAEMANFYKSYL